MTFTEWLGKLGEVVTSFVGWVSSCFNSLQNNFIILTLLGLTLFYFLFEIVLKVINYLRSRDPNNLDNYVPRHSKLDYVPKHSEEGLKIRKRG